MTGTSATGGQVAAMLPQELAKFKAALVLTTLT